ncbi:MAG: phage tail baseplate protein, partial [Roseiarcus sp.]
LTGGVAQIWVGASGIDAGGQSQWGGANVYVSLDNVTYAQVAVLTGPLRQGFLTASLPAAAGWDAVDTLAVNLSESGGTLAGTSQAAAQQGATLSIADSEFLAYENATLVSGNAYNLTGLARGQGGSSPAAHSTGAPFARVDGAVVRYTLPANFAGQTIFFKFQSFNVFGGGLEDLSTCAVYTFTPPAAATNPIFTQLATGFALDLGQVTAAPTLADDFGSVAVSAGASLDLGAVTVVVVHPIAVQLLSGIPLDLGPTTQAVTVSDDFGSVNDAAVNVINLGTVP